MRLSRFIPFANKSKDSKPAQTGPDQHEEDVAAKRAEQEKGGVAEGATSKQCLNREAGADEFKEAVPGKIGHEPRIGGSPTADQKKGQVLRMSPRQMDEILESDSCSDGQMFVQNIRNEIKHSDKEPLTPDEILRRLKEKIPRAEYDPPGRLEYWVDYFWQRHFGDQSGGPADSGEASKPKAGQHDARVVSKPKNEKSDTHTAHPESVAPAEIVAETSSASTQGSKTEVPDPEAATGHGGSGAESSQQTNNDLFPLVEQVLRSAIASLGAAKRDPSKIDAAIEDLENQIPLLASVSRPPIGEDGIIISQEPEDASRTDPPVVEEIVVQTPELDIEFWATVEQQVDLSMAEYAHRTKKRERVMDEFRQFLDNQDKHHFAFDEFRGDRNNPTKVARVDRLNDHDDLWFMGDLHGDLVAFEAALQYIRRECPTSARIVLLGDLIDRGSNDGELVLRIMEEVLKHPSQFCIIAGNHDEALAFNQSEGRFLSTVQPAEFVDWLNDHADREFAQELGKLTIELVQRLPRALFLCDGLLVTHGGIPYLFRELESFDDLERSPECVEDFAWTRAKGKYKTRWVKSTGRIGRGMEFGYKDFKEFCQWTERFDDVPTIKRMIRGHDHLTSHARYEEFPKWNKRGVPALTINTMCYRMPGEAMFGPYARLPAVAKWKQGKLPEVHLLKVPEELVNRRYPQGPGSE